MKLHEAIHWRADADKRPAVILAGVVLTSALAYLHFITGLAYEFHIFFSLPVLGVTWYAGAGAGYGVGGLAVLLWLIVNRMLGSDQTGPFPLLFNGAIRLALAVGEVWLLAKVRTLFDRERRLASEDSLTRLPNRRDFHERGRQVLAQAERAGSPITAVSFDLDKFKEVNDTLGHSVGDALLVCVADVLRSHLRRSDIPVRLGGDEFALLLPGMDSAAAHSYVSDLQRQLLAAMGENHWPVTFSIGVACYRKAPIDFDAMIAASDALMYSAKQGGRNRVVSEDNTAG